MYAARLFASALGQQPRTKPINFKTSSYLQVVGPLPCPWKAWREQLGWLGFEAACDGLVSCHYWGGKSWGASVDQEKGTSGLVWLLSLGIQVGFWNHSCRVTVCFSVIWAFTFLLGTCKAGLGVPGLLLAKSHLGDTLLLTSILVSQRFPILYQKDSWLSLYVAHASCPSRLQLPKCSLFSLP